MKKGSITWPDNFIQTTGNKDMQLCTFALRNAHGETLTEYPGLTNDEGEPDDDDEGEGHEDGPEYTYTFYATNLKEQFVAMLGYQCQALLNRMEGYGADHFFGDDEYFDYLPGAINTFMELHRLLQAHDLWNIFYTQAMKSEFAKQPEFKEVTWCMPEELPEIE